MQFQSAARRPSIFAILLAIGLAATISSTAIRPAMAETAGQASTRNIIIGAVATAAAIILYNNYQHKKAAARTIVGRTADGGIVYGNGQVVYPNGRVYYPSNDGRTACAYDGEGPYCDRNARLYEGRQRGHAYGRNKHHHDDQGDNNDNNENDNGDRGA